MSERDDVLAAMTVPVPGMDDDSPDPLASALTPADLDNGTAELVEERWRQTLRIDPEALNDEFYRCPNDIAYLAAVHAQAIGLHLRAKARAKRLLGLLRIRARLELETAGTKKPTESQVDARVDQMHEYQQAQSDEIDAEVARETAKGRVTGIVAKRDCLIQLGANHRQEMQLDPVIRDRAFVRRPPPNMGDE
jgi:hypothetical protein